ncbi:TetR family transcriptional regulator [Streptomyces camelliae]|uniref:TetR family transcriptional regulator n=1 Tax=Streptomyces camelliae TaxID=3004093 RepID=A0ABY7P5Q8_9ACTN|nr:TetR family transcriptional regulator [Streptomyces sp. HUAS 2-6]WBO64663.1 TetR family transcriptional regulator [Streptomyces sp. HUAS 2-6]
MSETPSSAERDAEKPAEQAVGKPAEQAVGKPAEQAAGKAARRRGRPPRTESADTRDRILTAAREEFSERGYEKASVRGIAKAAGVDSALVHHYFGTKEQVFEAAVAVAFAPALDAPDAVAAGPLDGVGERLTRFIFGIWENPTTRTPLLAIVRSAVNNDTAAAVFRRLIASQLLRRVAARVDLPDPELRAELAAAQLVGAAMLRYVIKLEPLASADLEQIVARVAPVVQHHLTDR